jgi:hypothetical protein
VKLFYTIIEEVPELEMALTAGGASESEYETHRLIGCEVLEERK